MPGFPLRGNFLFFRLVGVMVRKPEQARARVDAARMSACSASTTPGAIIARLCFRFAIRFGGDGSSLVKKTVFLSLLALSFLSAQEYTRGIGVYPGDPKEDFAPTMVPDTATYRNLAFHRPAYHSSSSDYNQTAQLVTDGIKETTPPRALVVTTSSQPGTPMADRKSTRLNSSH